jgi:hypothetical protein
MELGVPMASQPHVYDRRIIPDHVQSWLRTVVSLKLWPDASKYDTCDCSKSAEAITP